MYALNNEQSFIVNKAEEWFNNPFQQVFQYSGGPGTGKSFTLGAIMDRLGLDVNSEVAAISYIGSAALVMRLKGLPTARTIHSLLYKIDKTFMLDEHGNIKYDGLLGVPIMTSKFVPVNRLDSNIKLIVIDEAYTVPKRMKHQIEKFGVKIIATGDPNQLPPINDEPAYLVDGNVYKLTQNMRQNDRMDISNLATLVGSGVSPLPGFYGNSVVINKNQVTDNMLMWADSIICCKNTTRDMLNNRIRNILGYKSKLPCYGEKVICRKNNWVESIKFDNGTDISLVNGLVGKVINSPDVSSLSDGMFSMFFQPDLCQSVSFDNIRCNYKHMIYDYSGRESIRNNRFEFGNMFEYAYAITAHCAQGQQFHKVIYFEEHMHPSIQNKLNLVGASRADESLIYVKK